MDICINKTYKIKYKCNYSHIDEYEKFQKGKTEKTFLLNGEGLLEILGKHLLNDDCFEFKIKDNTIYISEFNPFNGTDSNYVYEIINIKPKNNS